MTTITPASATAIGVLGADFSLNRFNFPSAGTYAAQITDGGNTLSSYNTSAGLTVTLPAVNGLYPGWTMGFMTDNGKSLTITTTGPAVILVPGNGGGQTDSLKLGAGNYEFVQLRNDGANWRVTSTTPSTANDLGMITLPTSCALPGSGVLYNNSGTVRVC
jgi:hypothetical protein